MIYYDARYAGNDGQRWDFPSTDLNPKEKEKSEYNLAWARSIYSMHVRNKSGIPFDQLFEWDEQRYYGRGMQRKDKYKQIVFTEDVSTDETFVTATGQIKSTLEERRKGWKNVNDDIVSVAPKIKDVFHGLFDNQDFEISADAIDLNSGAAKDRAKYGLLAQSLFAKEYARVRQVAGIPNQQKDFIPRNITELEMFEAAGGFKLQITKVMEKILKHTFEISDWDHVLKKKMLDDVLDIGYVALRVQYDPDTYKTRVRYADPATLAIQYSKEDDYENSDWAGYYTEYTISELQQYGYSREELEKLAYDFSSKLGNPTTDAWDGYNKANSLGGWDYDFYKIPVYECEWIDADINKYLEWKSSKGKDRIKPVEFDVDESKYTKKSVKATSERIVRKARWIIGTDKVFDYGIAHDQIRPQPSKPILSYRVVKVTENPIFRRLKPILDKIQLAWLRYQNALIMSAGGGWAINLRLLNNLEIGGRKLKVGDVLRMMRQNNVLFFSDTPIHGQYQGGAVNPVTPLPSMLKDEIANAIQEFEYSIKQVEHITGLTPVALGGTPEERAGKATTELSFAATQNVMRPIMGNIMLLKQRGAESAMLHAQMLVRDNKKSYQAYADVVGEMDVATLKSAIHDGARYGIKLRAKPTEQEWAYINALVQEAISLGRDGVKSMEISDALMIEEMKSNGMNLSEVRRYLTYKIQQYKDEQQQRALQTQQLQQNAAAQLEQQKSQSEAQGKQFDAKADNDKIKLEHANDMQKEQFLANKEYKQKVMDFAHEEQMMEREAELEQDKPKTTP